MGCPSPTLVLVLLLLALCASQGWASDGSGISRAAGAYSRRSLATAPPAPPAPAKPVSGADSFDGMILTPPGVDINNLELPQLIVTFSEPQNPNTAVDKLLSDAAQALENVTISDNSTATGNITSGANLTVVGNISTPATAGQASSWGSNYGLQGLLVELPPQLDRAAGIEALQSLETVKTVIADRIIFAVQGSPRCVAKTELTSKGVPGNPSRSMPRAEWGRGMSACGSNTKLLWLGRTCYPSSVSKARSIQYDHVVATDARTGSIKTVNGQPCKISRSAPGKSSLFISSWLGSCSVVPVYNQNLPMCLLNQPPPPGVSGPQMPPSVVKTGSGTLVVVPKDTKITVAVCDSGVDATHPDLSVIGSQNFGVDASANFPRDNEAETDYYGHGTHVAGIAAARGKLPGGMIGVAPSANIYNAKILAGNGAGKMSSMLNAASWLAANGRDFGVQAATYSLVCIFPDNSAGDMAAEAICPYFAKVSMAGIVVAAAAGNAQVSLRRYFPADCPDVVAVTAVDNLMQGPGVYTNYLPDTDPQSRKETTLAAPGTSINSTMSSLTTINQRYYTLSGTSMAAPHVAGVAINCALGLTAVKCDSTETGLQKIAKLQAMARRHNQENPSYGFLGDPSKPIAGKHFGWLVWGGRTP